MNNFIIMIFFKISYIFFSKQIKIDKAIAIFEHLYLDMYNMIYENLLYF